ncbi:LOW QUALITY PROTEIN: hypothetical protein TorRG33x02_317120 [Trema orientale]|uniref:Uncharacterized protein n=1 Tax=Trema orientale TaxID=63057 RepID=A0A2P5BL04_TREOI|nr:LOW QUALITY PROTEIN: hypothetical protein TorRG33x02_317120 [Trema orientale]
MGSSSEKDLRSHMRLLMRGRVGGPGGSFLILGKKRLVRIDFRRKGMKAETVTVMMINTQLSILLLLSAFHSELHTWQRTYQHFPPPPPPPPLPQKAKSQNSQAYECDNLITYVSKGRPLTTTHIFKVQRRKLQIINNRITIQIKKK